MTTRTTGRSLFASGTTLGGNGNTPRASDDNTPRAPTPARWRARDLNARVLKSKARPKFEEAAKTIAMEPDMTPGSDLAQQFLRDGCASDAPDDSDAPLPVRGGANSNICPSCAIAMDTQGDEYVCSHCKRIAPHIDDHLTSDMTHKRDPRRHYSSSDPMKAQRNNVYESLIERRETYLRVIAARRGLPYVLNSSRIDSAGALAPFAPSTAAIIATARVYNDIQRNALAKGAPYVRRGDVKNEILAAILFAECGRTEQRSKKEIAEMMGLRTEGFSRGYEQLLLQSADGNITLDDDAQICDNKIAFYYGKTLGAFIAQSAPASDSSVASDEPPAQTAPDESPSNTAAHADIATLLRDTINRANIKFIRAVVMSSIRHYIGVRSQLQSKIVGAIWFIIVAMHYPIAIRDIDGMSGGIKKNTFLKFSRAIICSARLRCIAKRHFPHLAARGEIARIIRVLRVTKKRVAAAPKK